MRTAISSNSLSKYQPIGASMKAQSGHSFRNMTQGFSSRPLLKSSSAGARGVLSNNNFGARRQQQQQQRTTTSNPNMKTLTFVKFSDGAADGANFDNTQRLTSSFGTGDPTPASKQTSKQINLAITAGGNFSARAHDASQRSGMKQLTPSNAYGVILSPPKQLQTTIRETRKSTSSLHSNGSGSVKKLSNSYQRLYMAENSNTDKPLPTILKNTLKRARDMLLKKNIINDSPVDREKFPSYDMKEPMKNTPRELTLKLIKQHEYMLHRLIAVTEIITKKDFSQSRINQNVGGGTDSSAEMLKEIDAEETLSRQEVSIRTLKRENSLMRKQLESARLAASEKGYELEQTQSTSSIRNLNSQLQLKVVEAEKQAKDAYQQLAELQDQSARERQDAETLKFQLIEMQERIEQLALRADAVDEQSHSNRQKSTTTQKDDQMLMQSPPSNMSQFADEVKQQFLQQQANQKINLLNASSESSPTPKKIEDSKLKEERAGQNYLHTYDKLKRYQQDEEDSQNNSAIVSFARDDSQHVHTNDLFSVQALHDSLNANSVCGVRNDTNEVNLRSKPEKSSSVKRPKRGLRALSKGSGINQSSAGRQASRRRKTETQAVVSMNSPKVSSNFDEQRRIRNQLLTNSLSGNGSQEEDQEQFIEQSSTEQPNSIQLEQQRLANKLRGMQEGYKALEAELIESKEQLAELLEENNVTRVKFTTLLDTFQSYILEQDKVKKNLIASSRMNSERKNNEIADSMEEQDERTWPQTHIIREDKRLDSHSPAQTMISSSVEQLENQNNKDKKSINADYNSESGAQRQQQQTRLQHEQKDQNKYNDSLDEQNINVSGNNNNDLISIMEQQQHQTPQQYNLDEQQMGPSDFSQKVILNSSTQAKKNQTQPVHKLINIEHTQRQRSTISPRQQPTKISPRQPYAKLSSKGSLQLEADVSQSSFSFAVTPSQKPLFIQSVYLASLIRKLLNSWQATVVNSDAKTGNEAKKASASNEEIQAKLMSNLTNLDESQLLTKMLASLQVTLSFVQNLQEGIQVEEQNNMCEIKQTWQTVLSQVQMPSSAVGSQAHQEEISQISNQLSEPLESLSQMYTNKCLELAMYKQAIVSKGSDAQLMLKASIDDLMALKTENAKLREAVESNKFEKMYCASNQRQSQESLSTQGQFQQSFGAKPPLEKKNSLDTIEQYRAKCLQMQIAQVECEEQMKDGKSKIQESALIVQEVAKEIKLKDERIQKLSTKLLQILLIIDSGKTYEQENQDLEKLSDIVYQKVASLFNKCTKEKKMNRSFQETMLKELDNLNQALIEKKHKKKGDQHQGTNKRQKAVQQEEGPAQAQQSTRIAKNQAGSDSEQQYLSSYGRHVYGDKEVASGPKAQQVVRSSSVTSTEKENQQFLSAFQDLKHKMIRHQSPRQQQHPQASNHAKILKTVNAKYATQPQPGFSEQHRVMSCDQLGYRPQISSTDIVVNGPRNQFSEAAYYDYQRNLMSPSTQFSPRAPMSIASTKKAYEPSEQHQYKEGIQSYRQNMEGVVQAQRFAEQNRYDSNFRRYHNTAATNSPAGQLTSRNDQIAPYMSQYANELIISNRTLTPRGYGRD